MGIQHVSFLSAVTLSPGLPVQKSPFMNTSRAYHYLNLCLFVYLGFIMSIAIVISVARTNSVNNVERDFGSGRRESKFADSVCAEDVTRVEEIKAWRGANARDVPKQKLADILYRAISRPVQERHCIGSVVK